MPSGADQSWGFADPKAAAAAGVKVISEYHSWDQSKNMTAADVVAYHAVGIGMLHNWESQPGAPLKGAQQGHADAVEACRQVKAIHAALPQHPARNRVVIYFSCDADVTEAQWPTIDDYYRAAKRVCAANGYGLGAYGEAALVTHLHKVGITDSEWQTYAWSGGVLSPDADFYQFRNGQKLGGADVDFDRVIHPRQLGAWWPPRSPYNIGKAPAPAPAPTPPPPPTPAPKFGGPFWLPRWFRRWLRRGGCK